MVRRRCGRAVVRTTVAGPPAGRRPAGRVTDDGAGETGRLAPTPPGRAGPRGRLPCPDRSRIVPPPPSSQAGTDRRRSVHLVTRERGRPGVAGRVVQLLFDPQQLVVLGDPL